jgi:hypothetical protein
MKKILSRLVSLYLLALTGYAAFMILPGVPKVDFTELYSSRRMPWESQPKAEKPSPVISTEIPESQAEIPLADFDHVG